MSAEAVPHQQTFTTTTTTPSHPCRPCLIVIFCLLNMALSLQTSHDWLGERLDKAQREIRLITLEPGDQTAPITCSISRRSLNGKPQFAALSYVWGDSSTREPITVDASVTTVTANLKSALIHVRSLYKKFDITPSEMPIWADAVCINQDDVSERNQQVQMMRDIYSSAEYVFVCLGDGDQDTDWLFGEFWDKQISSKQNKTSSSDRGPPSFDEMKASCILDKNLMKRRWWTRVWVLQELVLSHNDPVLICGSKHCTWSELESVKDALKFDSSRARPEIWTELEDIRKNVAYHQDAYPLGTSFNSFPVWRGIRSRYHKGSRISIADTAIWTHMSQVTDSRDLVYGCLGMINDSDAAQLDVDYDKDPMEVFHDAMKVVWTDAYINPLANIIPQLSFSRDEGNLYPSWVPDFSEQKQSCYPWTAQGLDGADDTLFHPKWRSAQEVKLLDQTTLRLTGFIFDTVRDTHFLDMSMSSFFNTTIASALGKAEGFINEFLKKRSDVSLPPVLEQARIGSPVHDILGAWNDSDWLTGVEVDRDVLWAVYLGRAEFPESWVSSPEVIESTRGDPLLLERVLFDPITNALSRRVAHRKIFALENGFIGVGSPNIKPGDVIVLFFGVRCPYILRPIPPGFQMVGFGYVSGLWDIELLDNLYENGFLKETTFNVH